MLSLLRTNKMSKNFKMFLSHVYRCAIVVFFQKKKKNVITSEKLRCSHMPYVHMRPSFLYIYFFMVNLSSNIINDSVDKWITELKTCHVFTCTPRMFTIIPLMGHMWTLFWIYKNIKNVRPLQVIFKKYEE